MWRIAKYTGKPLDSNLPEAWDYPHTVTLAIALRMRYDSLLESAEPPEENIWDYPHLVRKHYDEIQARHGSKKTAVSEMDFSQMET